MIQQIYLITFNPEEGSPTNGYIDQKVSRVSFFFFDPKAVLSFKAASGVIKSERGPIPQCVQSLTLFGE
jgi:hypothetical protein